MTGILLCVQVPDSGDKGVMPLLLCPVNSFFLSLECSQYVVGMILHHIIIDACTFGSTLRASFYVDIGHRSSPIADETIHN